MGEVLDIAAIWAELEDRLFRALRLRSSERCVYYHLFRHSRLVGRRGVQTTLSTLARGCGLSNSTARERLRTLARKGCVRITLLGRKGFRVEVLLPDEIADCAGTLTVEEKIYRCGGKWYRNAELRAAILRRGQGRCFYCLRELRTGAEALDHVVPLAEGGDNSYRNVVACCHECNSDKGSQPAADFLRRLYRQNRLTRLELDSRLAALDQLHRGALQPSLVPVPAS